VQTKFIIISWRVLSFSLYRNQNYHYQIKNTLRFLFRKQNLTSLYDEHSHFPVPHTIFNIIPWWTLFDCGMGKYDFSSWNNVKFDSKQEIRAPSFCQSCGYKKNKICKSTFSPLSFVAVFWTGILDHSRFRWVVPVLQIRDVYPKSRILIFTYPGSRIQKQQ